MSRVASPGRLVAVAPNVLSAIRLAMAAVFPIVAPQWRLPIIVAAGLSDWLDGVIARRFHAGSTIGQLLDAVADKVFVLSVLVTLTVAGGLAWWQVLLVLARDLSVGLVTLYVAVLRRWSSFLQMVPRLPGKLTTAMQYALFATVLLWEGRLAVTIALSLTCLCSVLAAADYVRQFVTALREDAGQGSRRR